MWQSIGGIWKSVKYKKQFRNWVISYAAVALVSILVTMLGQGVTVSILRREVVKANSGLVAQAQLLCDEYLKDMETAANKLINTTAVKTVYNKYFESKLDKGSYYQTIKADANMVVETNKMLSDIYIVFYDKNICITKDTVFDKQILQETYFKDYFSSVEECMDALFDADVKQFKLIQDGQGGTKFLYIYTFVPETYFLENGKPPVAVVFEIDPSKVLGILREGADGQFILLDQDDTIIYADSGQVGYYDCITGSQPQTEFRFEGESYIANYLPSAQFGGKYVHVIQKSIYTKNNSLIYHIIIIVCILCVLIGLGLSVFFASYHYVPVEKLIDKMNLDKRENKKRDRQISELYLTNYLLGQYEYNPQQFQTHLLRLDRTYFALCVFNITEFGLDDDGGRHETTLFCIENIFSELMHDVAVNYYCVVDGFFVCLMNFNNSTLEETDIYEKALFANDFLNQHMGINFMSAVSSITEDAALLPKLYQQCVEYLTQKFIFQNTQVASHEAEDERCTKIKSYIEQHYSDDNLSVKSIADEFHMSFNYISKYFKEHTGEGMAKYIIEVRIEKAKELLTQSNDTVAKIAGKTGFYSSGVFIRTFKKAVGVTPGQYREQNKTV